MSLEGSPWAPFWSRVPTTLSLGAGDETETRMISQTRLQDLTQRRADQLECCSRTRHNVVAPVTREQCELSLGVHAVVNDSLPPCRLP